MTRGRESTKMKKAKSSFDLAPKPDLKFKNPMKYQNSVENLYQPTSKSTPKGNNHESKSKDDGGKHKVVIYFSDAYNNICNKGNGTSANTDIDHANRLASEMQSKSCEDNSTKDFMTQLKSVLEEKSKFSNKFDNFSPARPPLKNKFLLKPTVPKKPANVLQINQPANSQEQMNEKSSASGKLLLPSYIESIDENNVIKLKIEQNFKKASELVSLISSLPKKRNNRQQRSNETSSIHELNFSHEDIEGDDVSAGEDDDDVISEPDEGYFYDWSFVQEWRSR